MLSVRGSMKRAVDSSLAAEFLVLDRLFPRSLFHALRTAEHCLAELDPALEVPGKGPIQTLLAGLD